MERLLPLAHSLGEILTLRRETIAISESSTGGLISAAMLAVPGASRYFVGGGVVYTQKGMNEILNVNLKDHPGVRSSSEPYAALAADAIRTRLGTNWGFSETGAAGPTGNRYGDDAGHSCFAISGAATAQTTLETGLDDRAENMMLFAEQALTWYLEKLSDL